ncbi:MAG: iron ABC transporter permease [Spirochaetaceae bacterium]|nr:iron ABC transporter permease [Spirochaetaceae bacterium]
MKTQLKKIDAISIYKSSRKKCVSLAIILLLCLFLLVVFTVGLGVMRIPPLSILKIIIAKVGGNATLLTDIPEGAVAVVWDLRLPRILTGLLAGAGLSVAGLIFQAILQNPLADPYTLGVSTGAAFGAALAILLNMMLPVMLPISLSALVFAALTLFLVLFIAERGSGLASSNLVMAGIIACAILSAGISFIKMISGENVAAIVFWLMGSLSAKGWGDVALLAPVIPPALVLAAIFSKELNILTLGARSAEMLGVNVRRTRLLYLLLGAAISAVCVSVCGVIGFVGLVVPHILRLAVSSDNRFLMPLSALLGALLLAAADCCARLLSNGEIPVGVLTTLLGGPFFVLIFVRRRTA